MVTFPYERTILEWEVKLQTNKQTNEPIKLLVFVSNMPLKSSTNLIHMCDIYKFNSINSISTYDNYSLYLTKNFVFNIIQFKLKWGEGGGGKGGKKKTFVFFWSCKPKIGIQDFLGGEGVK